MIHGLVLAALLGSPPAPASQVAPPASPDLVVIDGKKHPEQIPEWLVWEHAFLQIGMLKGRETSFTLSLKEGLSAAEFEALENEALAQDERLAEAVKESEPLQEEYRKRDPEDAKQLSSLTDRLHAVNVKYRRATLDARDRVQQALRPESQSVVLSWIGELRTTIVARVAKGDLERWRAPE